ncbi:hypothetical protein B296_00043916 [Ensete ventricosum]|uniref:Uncharacterized protein n=1 Tax=Ensete ventricosum TaxID=4639 RepID=A0A426WXC5_ENSVE|nr:hypothetical protein B296_00043916 [Ensete ventricosum]
MKKCNGHKLYAKVEFRSVFRAPSQKFKILPIPDVLTDRRSYEHDFVKKLEGHILCTNRAQGGVLISFSCTIPKFKILAIPDVLAHGKSFEHDFVKKLDSHILCANRA